LVGQLPQQGGVGHGGGLLLVSMVVVAVNLAVDVLYGAIDPRIRHPRR
jgi:ABC-type dipeptide/oligopeptide/nickel transport system permease component